MPGSCALDQEAGALTGTATAARGRRWTTLFVSRTTTARCRWCGTRRCCALCSATRTRSGLRTRPRCASCARCSRTTWCVAASAGLMRAVWSPSLLSLSLPLSRVPCVCATAGGGCLPGHLAHGLPRNAQPRQGGRLQPRQTPGGASHAVGTATACRGGGGRRRALPSRAHLHPTQQVTPELYRELDHAGGGRGAQAAAGGGAAAGPTGARACVCCVC